MYTANRLRFLKFVYVFLFVLTVFQLKSNKLSNKMNLCLRVALISSNALEFVNEAKKYESYQTYIQYSVPMYAFSNAFR